MSTEEQAKTKTKRRRLSLILHILKYFRVPVLFIVFIILGLWIGYVKLGGQSASDMNELETWKHLINLVLQK